MKLLKGNKLTNKPDPYYIELSSAYSLLAEFSANPSQTDQPTYIDSQFEISAAMRHHEKKNDKIIKYIIENRKNDKVLINAAIKLAEDERNVMNKGIMTKGQQVTINETQIDTHEQKSAIEVRTW